MRTIAILPIKSLGAAKQRLGSMLAGGARQALAQAMFSDVLASLRHVEDIDEVLVVTADPVAETVAAGAGARLLTDGEEAGQSAAANIGIASALAAGFDRALLVPGDTPLLDPAELDGILERAELAATQVVIVPDRHRTGTNALLLSPPDAIAPSFGPGSFERHDGLARDAGMSSVVEAAGSLMLDVDTPEDLDELTRELAQLRRHAPMTRGALRQLDRVRDSAGGQAEAPARSGA